MLYAGLQNPGEKYSRNRHNMGGIVLQQLFADANFKYDKKSDALIAKNGGSVLVLPLTYMNRSGYSIHKISSMYKIPPQQWVILHDEIDLPPGEIRYKNGGGHRGHNGLRDIIKVTGSSDFHRIRLGVGRPENDRMSVADYVLSDFTEEEMINVEAVKELLKENQLIS